MMARGFQKLASRGAAMLQPEAGMVVEGWGDRSDAVSSAGLLLVTHGSQLGNDLAIGKLAKVLSPDFSEVAFCVLRGRPMPADTLSGMSASLVHIVPLLMASGRVGGHVLRSLLPTAERPRLRLHPPIGGHPGLAALVCDSINRVAEKNRALPRRTAAILVRHGNERNPASASAVYHLASMVRACGCAAAEVHCAFLSQPPLVERWRELTSRPDVIIVPCFLTIGAHVQLDLPALLRRDGAGHGSLAEMRRLWVTPPLATHCRGLADVTRDLVFRTPGTP
jgi:sirohydrochlorin ferrochelatase